MIDTSKVAENLSTTVYKPVTERQARELRPTPIRRDHVALYVAAIASLCAEVLRRPTLLPHFVAILRLAPRTIERLRTERRAA